MLGSVLTVLRGRPFASPPMAGGAGRSYLRGAAWAGLNAVASVLLPFAMFTFFAREITPAVLGMVAFATACTEVAKSAGMPGVYEALLQQKRDVARCHETALFLLLAVGTALVPACLAVLWGLGYLVHGLHERFLLLGLLTLRIPIDLVSLQPQAVLVERLAFGRLAVRTVVANVVAGAAGVAIALAASPVGGLVTYQLVQSVLTLASTAAGGGLLARPRLHRDCLRAMRGEMVPATGNRILAATINYLDQMMIAPLAGDVSLGFYNLGKRLETTFVTVANSFSAVLFQPLFASHGVLSKQKATLRALFVLTLVCGIPASVVFSDSRGVVGLMFGPRWLAAAPVVGWLSLNGFVRAIGMVPGSFLSVSGRNRELLLTSIVSAIGSLALVALLSPRSIALCAMALAVKNALIVGWMAWLARAEVREPVLTYLAAVLVPGGVMLAAAIAVAHSLPGRLAATPMQHVIDLGCTGLGSLLLGALAIGLAYALTARLAETPPGVDLRA